MKKLALTLAFLFFILINLSAQETCKVSVEALQGTYTGACEAGKANGLGKATGTDSYEGTFKNGYPEGAGVYTWANKSVYKGNFKKGIKEGPGKMSYPTNSGVDSTVSGFWKKDKYVGLYENPFIITNTTSRINKINCRLSKKGGTGTIIITTSQLTSQDGLTSSGSIPTIADVVVTKGLYIRKNNQTLPNSSIFTIQQIQFPFQAVLYYSNGEYFDITFLEEGNYDVTVNLQ